MKTLHLLRHAKAEPDDSAPTDHDRPLAKRGMKAAKTLAKHLQATGFAVDLVFCSTALRTRATYALVKSSLGDAPVMFRDRLYLIDPRGLLDFIREIPDTAGSALLIGHNPAYHELAFLLVGAAARGQTESWARVRTKFSTGALCSITFNATSWRRIAAGAGKLTAYIRPRDLE